MDSKNGFVRILFALGVAVLLLCIIIPILTSAIIDPYLHSTNRYVNMFEFYKNNTEDNKIFFIGNSYTRDGVNASAVEIGLNNSYKVYNMGVGGDTPKHRIVELESIIESKPKIAVLGVTYGLFRGDSAFVYSELVERAAFSRDEIKLDSYSEKLFNKTELGFLQEDYAHFLAYKRSLLVPGLLMAAANQLRQWKIKNVNFLKAEKPATFKFKEYRQYQLVVCNITNEKFANLSLKVGNSDNNNKKAFLHMVEKMKKAGIYVILVNMPLNPNYSVIVNNESRKNYMDIIGNLECPYYDLEALCTPIEFRDHGHSNLLGQGNITNKMTDILVAEVRNASQ